MNQSLGKSRYEVEFLLTSDIKDNVSKLRWYIDEGSFGNGLPISILNNGVLRLTRGIPLGNCELPPGRVVKPLDKQDGDSWVFEVNKPITDRERLMLLKDAIEAGYYKNALPLITHLKMGDELLTLFRLEYKPLFYIPYCGTNVNKVLIGIPLEGGIGLVYQELFLYEDRVDVQEDIVPRVMTNIISKCKKVVYPIIIDLDATIKSITNEPTIEGYPIRNMTEIDMFFVKNILNDYKIEFTEP
jgi:hypothetical protein